MTRSLLAIALLAASTPALADDDCPDLAERLAAAWSAFDEAELAQVGEIADAATRQLDCQVRVLDPDELYQLYLLDAAASVARGDEESAVSAAIRAVTLAPDRPVDPRFGPAVANLLATWERRLGAARVTLRVERAELPSADGPPLHLDGRPVPPDGVARTIEGEHVLQWRARDALHTEVRELQGDLVAIVDGSTLKLKPASKGGPAPSAPPAPEGGTPTGELPIELADEPSSPSPAPSSPEAAASAPPPRSSPKVVGTPAAWGTGLALAALGGAGVGVGNWVEARFLAAPYDAPSYEGCLPRGGCYAEARQRAIDRDVTLIRALYGASYGFIGLGATLFGVGLAVEPRDGGAKVTVSVPLGGPRRGRPAPAEAAAPPAELATPPGDAAPAEVATPQGDPAPADAPPLAPSDPAAPADE
jgi:hypothetical protein